MKKLHVFRTLFVAAVFAALSVGLSGCFYPGYSGYARPYGYGYGYRPYARVYAPPVPRYYHHGYSRGGRGRRY